MLFYLALIKYEYIYIHISYINLVFYIITNCDINRKKYTSRNNGLIIDINISLIFKISFSHKTQSTNIYILKIFFNLYCIYYK